jgi:hypothetical protein
MDFLIRVRTSMASLVSGLTMSVTAQDVLDNAEDTEVEEHLKDHDGSVFHLRSI